LQLPVLSDGCGPLAAGLWAERLVGGSPGDSRDAVADRSPALDR